MALLLKNEEKRSHERELAWKLKKLRLHSNGDDSGEGKAFVTLDDSEKEELKKELKKYSSVSGESDRDIIGFASNLLAHATFIFCRKRCFETSVEQ